MAALLLGSVAPAWADLNVTAAGSWRVHGNFTSDGETFGMTKDYGFFHRMRTQFRFVYTEAVMGELYTEYGNVEWGVDEGAFGVQDSLDVKRAFIQFRWPNTDMLVTVGEQDVTLPHAGAFSNIVLGGDDGSAAAVSVPFTDMFALTAMYARHSINDAIPDPTDPGETIPVTSSNIVDVFLAAVPVSLDGMTLTPWFTYVLAGENSLLGDDAWIAGLAFNMDLFDPFIIYADFMYGDADDGGRAGLANGTSGWLADAMVEFRGLDFAVLQAFGAYSSQNSSGNDALPYIVSDWGIGGTLVNGSAFGEGDFGPAVPGFWLAGAALRSLNILPQLYHDLIGLVASGTASGTGGFLPNSAGEFLTSNDTYWEIDFNHRYQLFESLAAIVELAYADSGHFDDSILKGSVGFRYNF